MLKVVGASWTQTKVSSLLLAVVVALGVVIIILGEVGRVEEDGNYSATVYWSEGSGFRIEYWGEGNDLEEIPHGASRAVYSPRMDNTGWARFEVETHQDYPDWVQAYAAGLLEGSLSWQLMYWHWQNTIQDTCKRHEQLCDDVRRFVVHNREWVRSKAKHLMHKDPFWHQVELFYTQLDGLEAGWRKGVDRSRQSIDLPHDDFLWMNAMMDVLDLERKLGSTEKLPERSIPATFSSAFIKLLPETKQLFVAHNTGARYQSMLRMMKRYHFNYHLLPRNSFEMVPGKEIVFSSYPGALSSQDDFYVVTGTSEAAENAHKIVVAGTAIDNYSNLLWSKVNTDKVLTTARVMVANRLASDGKSWSKHLEKYNSGTGNKQWVVADYGRLIRIHLDQQAVKINTLHIIEPQMTSRTSLEKDDLSAHVIHVEARKSEDAAPSIRLWEVKGKQAESRESMHETQLVLETSQLFDHGDVSTPQSKEVLDAAQDMSETLDEEESFDTVESVDLNDAEWLDRSFMRSHRKFSSYKGLLWVVEQLPGMTRYSDRSHTLHKSGYWASYGVPYFKDILDASETANMQQHNGEITAHQEHPKAVIFRKNQRNVTDLRSIVSLMHSTNPLPDALSSTNTQHVIAERGDLALGAPVGTTDTKIFTGFPGQLSSLNAIAGPSYNVDSTSNHVTPHVIPFQWSKSSFSKTTPHFGQSDTWQFPLFTPQWAWNRQKGTKVS